MLVPVFCKYVTDREFDRITENDIKEAAQYVNNPTVDDKIQKAVAKACALYIFYCHNTNISLSSENSELLGRVALLQDEVPNLKDRVRVLAQSEDHLKEVIRVLQDNCEKLQREVARLEQENNLDKMRRIQAEEIKLIDRVASQFTGFHLVKIVALQFFKRSRMCLNACIFSDVLSRNLIERVGMLARVLVLMPTLGLCLIGKNVLISADAMNLHLKNLHDLIINGVPLSVAIDRYSPPLASENDESIDYERKLNACSDLLLKAAIPPPNHELKKMFGLK